ncbi:hypothetical protein ECANGB1_355 [Enterospora canceri]|uniref:Uncharacterized protein n=1 Tax=Enterospora canceri TaxID=1081671 RepID=A0A1Y1S4I5_9MICR|nr:hypothetical protein ECANGB1_355 [Enterospora canceri]
MNSSTNSAIKIASKMSIRAIAIFLCVFDSSLILYVTLINNTPSNTKLNHKDSWYPVYPMIDVATTNDSIASCVIPREYKLKSRMIVFERIIRYPRHSAVSLFLFRYASISFWFLVSVDM